MRAGKDWREGPAPKRMASRSEATLCRLSWDQSSSSKAGSTRWQSADCLLVSVISTCTADDWRLIQPWAGETAAAESL